MDAILYFSGNIELGTQVPIHWLIFSRNVFWHVCVKGMGLPPNFAQIPNHLLPYRFSTNYSLAQMCSTKSTLNSHIH